ncbi:hypothetical protein [Salibacter halophilus]|uniref:Uncharacterized protein n=1 Tax=Salibacter halophilus TaxID=1803916 RepID=A0A6N6MBR7_9FLAO|nr:hypothetical protein [Salibacter halophilus]KAB1065973.1 hypothetical protein F3059_00435 [Salibacter halophilus]
MRLFVTFKQQNPDFNKEYADEYHFGKGSDGNWKDNWSEGLKCPKEVEKISINQKGTIKLIAKSREGSSKSFTVDNMIILEGIVGSKIIYQFAVSKDLVKKTHKAYNGKYDTTRFYFYFKSRNDYVKIEDSIYVLEEDLPK